MNPKDALHILTEADEVCSASEAAVAVARVAREVSDGLADANPLVLVVLRGGVVFAGQLLTLLKFPLNVDSIDATRYGESTSGGNLVFRSLPMAAVADRTVLLVDDILDEGITLKAIRDKLLLMGASRVLIAVFSEKQTGRPKPLRADYVGVTVPDRYVFGFGMDVHGYWRNLPAVYAMKEQG